jgi:Fic family protein
MLRQGYWLFEFISISEILLKAPAKYARAFLYAETDENDLTYFIVHQTRVINQAMQELHAYIDRKSRDLAATEAILKSEANLNHRQQALIAHALRHPNTTYTVQAHQESHKVVYETARRDLMDLVSLGWLSMRKSGKAHVFVAPETLGSIVQKSRAEPSNYGIESTETPKTPALGSGLVAGAGRSFSPPSQRMHPESGNPN